GGFSLRMPRVGVALEPGRMRGYIVPVAGSSLQMTVRLPAGVDAAGATVWVQGRIAPAQVAGSGLRFTLPTSAGAPANWAVTWSSAPQASPAGSLPNTSPKLPLVAVLVLTGMMVLLAEALSLRRRRG